jgi:serine-type D-Ala-D-Ala carboxypeptidase/endopeptidase (penicillin-binding protein 4)
LLDFLTTLWINLTGQPQIPLQIKDAMGVSRRIGDPWSVLIETSDLQAQQLLGQYLKKLSAQGLPQDQQGLWMQSGVALLANNQGKTPLPAASLTKVATSLAALETWGPQHQFDTLIATDGAIQNGILQGNLIVQGSGDPMFVTEEAIALGVALNQLGIRQVTGDLVITGNFMMNFEWDPLKSGSLLKQALNAGTWSEDMTDTFAKLPPNAKLAVKPQVAIAGNVRYAQPVQANLLIQHQSLPLWNLIKRLNIYSNNVMAEMLSRLAGGPQATAAKAAQAAGVSPNEVLLANGSGLGVENRISPHAVVAMFAAVKRYAEGQGMTIADLFPIAGTDKGTVEDREIPIYTVVKTGTLNDVSALAGFLPTRDQGVVVFSVINRGANLDGLRSSQDVLLQQGQSLWGKPTARPMELTPTQGITNLTTLGTMQRNRVPVAPK